jgi:hypothetical protein
MKHLKIFFVIILFVCLPCLLWAGDTDEHSWGGTAENGAQLQAPRSTSQVNSIIQEFNSPPTSPKGDDIGWNDPDQQPLQNDGDDYYYTFPRGRVGFWFVIIINL